MRLSKSFSFFVFLILTFFFLAQGCGGGTSSQRSTSSQLGLGVLQSGLSGESLKMLSAPKEFAFTISPGNYGLGDELPQNPATFENLLVNMKKAGFNTLYGVYRDWRVELCRKYGIKLMVDVLAWKPGAETDVRRDAEQRERVKDLMEKSRNDNAIWGYNLWNETQSFFGRPNADGLGIDDYVKMLKEWDSTHPIWVGTYRNYSISLKQQPGVYGYYDYAWQRGFNWHFADLLWYQKFATERNGVIGEWDVISNYNFNSYKINTSIPFGLKVMIWFIGAPFDGKGNIDTHSKAYHLVQIGQEMHNLYAELGNIGMPTYVFSSPTTKWQNNTDKKLDIPWNLKPFPADFWIRVVHGEALVGFFKYPNGEDALYVANHNAYASQNMVLAFKDKNQKGKVEILNRVSGKWENLKLNDGKISFDLRAAGGELLRVRNGR